MKYFELSSEVWSSLKDPDKKSGGYPSITLEFNTKKSALHIFRDKYGYYHFAIETPNLLTSDLINPKVNGLKVDMTEYRLEGGLTTKYIDITCNIIEYVKEFTEIVKDISKAILVDNQTPLFAVNQTIANWMSFWSAQRNEALCDEAQIGLICELLFLEKILLTNSDIALNHWTGPLAEKHDFSFTNWSFEVKGTRKKGRIHTVNGIDQLQSPPNKKLGFVSYLVSVSKDKKKNTINIPELVEILRENYLKDKPDLVVQFNCLLAENGYSPIHNDYYFNFNLDIISAKLFEVDAKFPKLTSEQIVGFLSNRISLVRYDVTLEGLQGIDIEKLNFYDYL